MKLSPRQQAAKERYIRRKYAKDMVQPSSHLFKRYYPKQYDAMEKVREEYLKIDNEVNGLLKHSNGFFEEYKLKDAEKVIVCLGSTAGVVKEVVNPSTSVSIRI